MQLIRYTTHKNEKNAFSFEVTTIFFMWRTVFIEASLTISNTDTLLVFLGHEYKTS